jgi:putative flavoprotein involved in K+ transport
VSTERGDWNTRAVVLATGACNVPCVPKLAETLPPTVKTLTPMAYRNPDQLDPGGVLVVGASATGLQLADEIHRSGRPVTLAVGEHIRAPRTYRGKDIQWWMDVSGVLGQRYDEVDDLARARGVPSLQLVGCRQRVMLDLNALAAIGVRLVGRLAGISDGRLQFSGSLRNHCALSDLKMNRLLDTIDRWATDNGLDGKVDGFHRFPPTTVEESPPLSLRLERGEITTIIWATGFRPDTSWLDVPVLDRKGRIDHDGGVVASPGMYLMGMPFLRRRKSALIDGAGDDARELGDHLASYLAGAGGRAGIAPARRIFASESGPLRRDPLVA